MGEKLFLQFPDIRDRNPDSENVLWFYVSDNQIKRSGHLPTDELSSLKQEYSSVSIIVLIPSSDCLVTKVPIPTRQKRQQLKAVPFAVEEQLAEDIGGMHFAIGKCGANNKLPVIAIAKTRIAGWLAILSEAGLSPTAMLPLSALLEAPEGAWSIFQLGELFLVNQDGICWDADAEQTLMMLQLSIDKIDENKLPALLFWGTDDAPKWLSGLGLELSEQLVQDPQQALLSRFDHQCINLLQGEYGIRDDWQTAWSIWRNAAIFVLIAVLLKFAVMSFDLYRLDAEKQYIKQEITRIYQQVAPGARVTAYPKRQMQQLLAKKQGTHSQSGSFLVMLSQLGNSLSTTPGSRPTNISYDNSRSEIRIDLLVSSLPQLDQLKDKLVSKGLSVEVGGASAQGKDYSGRLIIRSGS